MAANQTLMQIKKGPNERIMLIPETKSFWENPLRYSFASIILIVAFAAIWLFHSANAAHMGSLGNSSTSEEEMFEDVGEVFVLSLGGKIYDDLWVMTGEKAPVEENPAFPLGADKSFGTWRCVSCHGWDYKGRNGERGSAGNSEVSMDLSSLRGENPATIAARILGEPHQYDRLLLNDFVIEVLALFISVGQYPVEKVIDGDGIAQGDKVMGLPKTKAE